MSAELDENGNPDVMGPRAMDADQERAAQALKLLFNEISKRIAQARNDLSTPRALTHHNEAMRLLAIAQTHLEISCMAAVKGISRL